MKQAAEETKQTLGIPVGATYTADRIGILWWVIPDNRPDCSYNWTVFCSFHDC